jgi:hypothetical protein
VANVMRLAAERGDVDELLAQFDRYLRLSGNRPLSQYTGIYTSFGAFAMPPASPPVSFGRAMGARADAKAHADILKLFDHYLAAVRQPDQVAFRKRSRLASPTVVSRQFQIWFGKQTRWVNIDYPSPNTYYDLGAIQLLRTAFELYKRDDLVSDLLAHFTKLPESASETDRVYAELAQGYLHWWAEEKDEALQSLTRAAALSKSDPELLLDLAELRAQRNEPEEALAVADSFEPLDQRTTQRREILALRLAVLTGDIDRARRAAERLFNLRLDADTQVQLAAQMHQLGMHELAEAVLGRARRRVGNNVTVLVNLMNQYQRRNKPEVAVQVAYQILRRNSSRRNNPNFYYNENDQAQREAIGVLARSGKLKDLIARAEAQLERSPNSVQLHQALADYYQAAGEKDKVKAEYETIAKIRPDDARLRFQVAKHLQQSGDNAAAIEHYKAAFKKEPSLFGNGYWEIEQLFEQANQIDELLALLDKIDMHQLGQPWSIGDILSRALRESKRKEVGKKLFIKAWQAFPNERGNLLAYVHGSDGITEMPEMYDCAREVALPAADQTRVAPWSGIDQIILWMGEGKVLGYGNFLLEVATRQAKLGSLAEELRKAVARRPEWRGGQVLLALVKARRGRVEQAQPTLQALLVDDKDNRPPAAASLIIGLELEQYEPLQEIALRLYEEVMKESSNGDFIDEFEYSPAQRVVAIDKRLGRNEAARQQILQYLRKGDSDRYSFDVRYAAYQKIQQRTRIGALLLELGFPADAVRLYAELLADGETLKLAREMGWRGDLDRAINRAIEGLDRDTLGPTLKSLMRSDGQKANGPAVDLVLLAHPRDLEHAALTSLFAASLQAAADAPALFDEVRGRLEKLAAENPHDLSVQIAAALAALMTGKAAALAPALARLEKLVAETPLEELPANARANARQRAEASPQMALWLVARECAKQKGCEEIGARLADRALQAARRQSDPFWSLAMLRESAQAALAKGDRALAEARYAQMLDVILVNPSAPKAGATAPAVATAASKTKKDAAPKAPNIPVTTLDRFEEAMRLAQLVAGQGMTGLSLRAVRETLRGGPPVVPITVNRGPRTVIVNNNMNQEQAQDEQVQTKVEQSLSELDSLWQANQAEPAEVYAALAQAVLPDARPAEVFLYPLTLTGNTERPRSVAGLLVRWALRAGRADELHQRVVARQAQPLAEVPAGILLGQLAQARQDRAATTALLEGLAKRLEKDKLQTTAELACPIALTALADAETEPAAIAVIQSALTTLSGSNRAEPAESLYFALARHQFQSGRTQEGNSLLRDAMALGERVAAMGQKDTTFQRRQVYRKIASEFARAGQWSEALEVLGQYADVPAPPYYNNEQGVSAIAAVTRLLAALPAQERYATLKTWTLPTATRKSVRVVAAFVPEDAPPEVFGQQPAANDRGVASTIDLLIGAARELGKLEELAQELQKAVEAKVENAADVLALVQLAQGQDQEAELRLKALLEEWTKRREADPNPWNEPRKDWWPSYLAIRAAFSRPALAELSRRLARKFPNSYSDFAFPPHLTRDLAAAAVAGDGAKTVAPGLDPGLALWTPTDLMTAEQHLMGPVPPWWTAYQGHIHHKVGGAAANPYAYFNEDGQNGPAPGPDAMVFRLPLTGRFAFSVEVHGASGALGYGGLVLQPGTGGTRMIWRDGVSERAPNSVMVSVGGAETIPKLCQSICTEGYNRLTVRVEPGKVTYLINGSTYFEDTDPSPTAPWLTLFAGPSDPTDFRNPILTGSPEKSA